jgi:hypothetical protein
MGHGLDGRGSNLGRCKKFFCTPQRPDRATQPLIQWVPEDLSLNVKFPGRETDLSPPSNADVKNGGAIPPYTIYLHGVVLNYLRTGIALSFALFFIIIINMATARDFVFIPSGRGQRQDSSLVCRVQTASRAHPASK